jgi:hypothetical protein
VTSLEMSRASYLTEDNTVYLGLDELWATFKVCQSLNGSIIIHEIHICPEESAREKMGVGICRYWKTTNGGKFL